MPPACGLPLRASCSHWALRRCFRSVVSVSFCRKGFSMQEPITSLSLHIVSWPTFTISGMASVNGFTETIP